MDHFRHVPGGKAFLLALSRIKSGNQRRGDHYALIVQELDYDQEDPGSDQEVSITVLFPYQCAFSGRQYPLQGNPGEHEVPCRHWALRRRRGRRRSLPRGGGGGRGGGAVAL